jgi:hypothetical protein
MKKHTTHKKGGWKGHGLAHQRAKLKSLGFKNLKAHAKKVNKTTLRGLHQDKRIKAKTVRQPWQPHWRGDLKGSKV